MLVTVRGGAQDEAGTFLKRMIAHAKLSAVLIACVLPRTLLGLLEAAPTLVVGLWEAAPTLVVGLSGAVGRWGMSPASEPS